MLIKTTTLHYFEWNFDKDPSKAHYIMGSNFNQLGYLVLEIFMDSCEALIKNHPVFWPFYHEENIFY